MQKWQGPEGIFTVFTVFKYDFPQKWKLNGSAYEMNRNWWWVREKGRGWNFWKQQTRYSANSIYKTLHTKQNLAEYIFLIFLNSHLSWQVSNKGASIEGENEMKAWIHTSKQVLKLWYPSRVDQLHKFRVLPSRGLFHVEQDTWPWAHVLWRVRLKSPIRCQSM